MRDRWEQLTGAAAVVAAVTLGLVAGTGVMVTRGYRPDGGGPPAMLPSSVGWSRRLVEWHAWSVAAALVALLVWCVLVVAGHGWRNRRAAIAVGSTIGSVVALAASVVAWHRVRWDQLALWAVTVGLEVSGLWYAAFSDQVRFVVVGSHERAQADVAPWVVVYLVAPFLALGIFAIAWLTTRPRRGARRTVVAMGT